MKYIKYKDARIVELYKTMTLQEVGKALGISTVTVLNGLRFFNVPRRPKNILPDGSHTNSKDVCKRYGDSKHRKAYTKAYGEIPEGYDVHHIDFNKDNNEPSNLVALPHGIHRQLHIRQRKLDSLGGTT